MEMADERPAFADPRQAAAIEMGWSEFLGEPLVQDILWAKFTEGVDFESLASLPRDCDGVRGCRTRRQAGGMGRGVLAPLGADGDEATRPAAEPVHGKHLTKAPRRTGVYCPASRARSRSRSRSGEL